ncbi:hypothetical protein B0A49_06128 [Cryomyces minteri]|uniref:RGS domain-containing protein n=1 Tax=Cryomyces minteri TaxID=331657 RepID=A0A4U0X484_9PEZI|nr:hypothetical protein B0A49_06128 [Cryomyces minteri]
MDASRYRRQYNTVVNRSPEDGGPATSEECEYVRMLWERLVDAYIKPNGPREVNLTSEIRHDILSYSSPAITPPPEALDAAVQKTYELMEESVLGPFLNSCCPTTAHPTPFSDSYNTSQENIHMGNRSYDDRVMYSRRARHARNSPPPASAIETHSFSYSPSSSTFTTKQSPPSNISTSISRSSASQHLSKRISPSHKTSHSPSTSAGGSSGTDPMLTDDSGSVSSPTADPMTPPTTPQMGEHAGLSPRTSRDGNTWKKMSSNLSKLGWKPGRKKSDGRLRGDETTKNT